MPLPYFPQPSLEIGRLSFLANPLTIHAFGALVACSIVIGSEIVRKRAISQGLDPLVSTRLVTWCLVGGFIGAHLVDRFFYFPKQTLENPVTILYFWSGISSTGGFVGATCGSLLFASRGHMKGNTWRYLDAFVYAFPFAWILGRTGCFLAFDHPGLTTDFFLSQVYADGQVRHNLGLNEAIFSVFWAAGFYVLGRKPRFPGFFVAMMPIIYLPFRFFLDFLRKEDARYLGLTPAQFICIGLFALGLYIYKVRSAAAQVAPAGRHK